MHSTFLSDASESDICSPQRFLLLASLLSLSPGRLLRYVAAVHGPRGVSESSDGFPPLMHAILLALALPFSSPDATADQSAATSQSRKSTSKNNSAERPSLLDTQEQLESMRSVVVPRRASSKCSRSSSSQRMSDKNSNDSMNSSCSRSSSPLPHSTEEDPEQECPAQNMREKRKKIRVSLRRDFSPERSAALLLRDLAEPLLSARSAIAQNSSSSSSRKESLFSRSDPQYGMQLLPRELHSASGVARVTNLCPPFLPLFLAVLIKESVRADAFGLSARHAFIRLVELSAPLFLSPRGAALARAVERLVAAAAAALCVFPDSHWALEIGAALVVARVAPRGALRAPLERRAADVAKAPAKWAPPVALAYGFVTEERLCVCAAAEDKEGREERARERSETQASVASGTDIKETSVSGSPTFPSAAKLLTNNSSAPMQWSFPNRLPSTFTLTSAMVITCMVLCRQNMSKRTVVAIASWCLRAVSELPATPCAVALTHLMLQYPIYLSDVTVRGSSSGGSSGGKGSDAAQAAFGQVQTPVVPNWMATVTSSVRFADAVVIVACRLAEVALRKYARQRADVQLSTQTRQLVDNQKETDEEEHKEEEKGKGEEEKKQDDWMLDDLHDAQCYLLLLLQAIVLRRGSLLSSTAQDELAALFMCVARLRIVAGPSSASSLSSLSSLSPRCAALHARAAVLCDEAFRAVARAVDVLLHDYAAGYPRRLCEALAVILLNDSPNTKDNCPSGEADRGGSAVAAELRRAGAWERHADCLESIDAAALYAAAGKRSAAETAVKSLAGELPSSGEPLRIGSGARGLAAAQRLWWARRAVAYLAEQWWRARGTTVLRCRPDEEGKSFLECCPQPI